jgi:hypothetical protein
MASVAVAIAIAATAPLAERIAAATVIAVTVAAVFMPPIAAIVAPAAAISVAAVATPIPVAVAIVVKSVVEAVIAEMIATAAPVAAAVIATIEAFFAPARRVGHPAGLRIGIEPLDAPLRGHPFDSVMRPAIRPHERTIGIGEGARVLFADLGKDLVERRAAPRESRCRQATHGNQSENQGQNAGTHGLFLVFSK